MARAFTLDFSFLDNIYNAYVCLQQKQEDDDTEFHVRLLNKELFEIIPQGEFIFNSNDGLHMPKELHHNLAAELILSVTAAISTYLLNLSLKNSFIINHKQLYSASTNY